MSTSDTIRDFITREILHGSQMNPLQDQDLLIESGIIDSLGIMTLLTFLEEEFSIEVPGDELIPENFESIIAITAMVERRKN